MICVTSVDTIRTPVVDVIGQLIRDVIGRLSVEPRCNWLGRLNSQVKKKNWKCYSQELLERKLVDYFVHHYSRRRFFRKGFEPEIYFAAYMVI